MQRQRDRASASCIVYVRLLDEGVDVRRPVEARKLGVDVYRILEQAYDRDDETWEFEPGSTVRCEFSTLNGREVLIAMRQV